MHPILANRTRTLLYIAAWIPAATLLTQVLVSSSAIAWADAAAIVFPMCFVYAFICQATWYLCSAVPLRERVDTTRLIATHATATIVSAAAWVVAGWGWAWFLEYAFTVPGLAAKYAGQVVILFLCGVMFFAIGVAFSYLMIAFEDSQHAQRNALELQVLAREAELRALRAQIDPHFLFNSLNSINALVMTDPKGARRMCVLLAEFLRGSLKHGSEERIPLAEEIRLAECYLDIERVRLGERLQVRREIDPQCERCLVPPLIMQPLVENAITHGVAPSLDGGIVSLQAELNGAGLKIVVENAFEPDAVAANGAGVGLKNVKMRLANLYEDDARMDVDRNGGRFRVELQIPCE